MTGFDHNYKYPVQVETITTTNDSYVAGFQDRAEALAYAKKKVADKHAGTVNQGCDCTIVLHTEHVSWVVHRAAGHTNRAIAKATA